MEAGKWQISTNGGSAPVWAHNGQELFYVDSDRNLIAARWSWPRTSRGAEAAGAPTTSGDPITRLNAPLEGRYTIEPGFGEGGMAKGYLCV